MRRNILWISAGTAGCLAAASALLAVPAASGYPLERKGVITHGFNVKWAGNPEKLHTGIDIAAKKGTEVYAAKSGTIEKQGWLGKGQVIRGGKWVDVDWGYYLIIRNDVGSVFGYLHINPHKTYIPGSRIRAGTKIGVIFEDHLHLNECYQLAGCQHGAYPNATFTEKMGKLTKYYVKPTF